MILYKFTANVKPFTPEDLDFFEKITAVSIVNSTYFSDNETVNIGRLYATYCVPVWSTFVEDYLYSADRYPNTNRRPNRNQAKLHCLSMHHKFSSKGELTAEQAADLFFSAFEVTTIYQQALQHYYERATVLPSNITTMADVQAVLSDIYDERQLAYHPDTAFEDYERDGQPLYTAEQAEKLNELNDQAFDVCVSFGSDIYAIALYEGETRL